MNNHYQTVFSWSKIEQIYDLALDHAKPGDMFIEIGCFFGRSICYLGEMARRRKKDIHIVAIDPFDFDATGQDFYRQVPGSENVAQVFHQNILAQGLDVIHIAKHSHDAIADVKKLINKLRCEVGIVFVDGDHSYRGCRDDMEIYNRLCPRILAGHDYDHPNFPGVRQAVDEFSTAYSHLAFGHIPEETVWFYTDGILS